MEEHRAGSQNVETLLAQGRTVQFPTTGWSMYPFIVNGRDQVIVEPSGPDGPKRGDVVLYRRPDSILVLHRIWKRDKNGIYLVGDNQTEIEGPLDPSVIRGVMTALVRKGKVIPTTDFLYRFISGLWLLLRPVRRWIAVPVAAIKRVVKGYYSGK